jgi:putative lipoic acid-binding regulatory protein
MWPYRFVPSASLANAVRMLALRDRRCMAACRGRRGLGFARRRPDNAAMDITSDNPEHGFQFPGVFELSAMGTANTGLETELPRLLAQAGVDVLEERISWKHSSNGKYVSVRIAFRAADRAQYDAAHLALREHPEVKWTL